MIACSHVVSLQHHVVLPYPSWMVESFFFAVSVYRIFSGESRLFSLADVRCSLAIPGWRRSVGQPSRLADGDIIKYCWLWQPIYSTYWMVRRPSSLFYCFEAVTPGYNRRTETKVGGRMDDIRESACDLRPETSFCLAAYSSQRVVNYCQACHSCLFLGSSAALLKLFYCVCRMWVLFGKLSLSNKRTIRVLFWT